MTYAAYAYVSNGEGHDGHQLAGELAGFSDACRIAESVSRLPFVSYAEAIGAGDPDAPGPVTCRRFAGGEVISLDAALPAGPEIALVTQPCDLTGAADHTGAAEVAGRRGAPLADALARADAAPEFTEDERDALCDLAEEVRRFLLNRHRLAPPQPGVTTCNGYQVIAAVPAGVSCAWHVAAVGPDGGAVTWYAAARDDGLLAFRHGRHWESGSPDQNRELALDHMAESAGLRRAS